MAGFTINQVVVSGNLTRDPETRSFPSGMSVCNFSLAVNERVKDKDSGEWGDRVNYFDCSTFGGMGEWLGNNLTKGSGVVVSGRLQWRSWEKDGVKRSAVSIVADSVVTRNAGESGGGGGGYSSSSGSSNSAPVNAPTNAPLGGGNAPAPVTNAPPAPSASDEIPF
jgi:single-strand DNA-binding protein